MGSLISVNVGLPRDVEWEGKTVHTAVWKTSVPGRVMARRLNIDGDAQGDLAGHGGEHRAVMVYQLESYEYWQKYLGRSDFIHGQFGENLTVQGLPDGEVCIGDRYRIGGAVFEVTQPRVTCYRVGIRMNHPEIPALLVSHRRPGFYFRVIEEGEIGAGDEIVKVLDGPEKMSVADVDGLLYLPGHEKDKLARALLIPALSEGWKGSLESLLKAGESEGNAGLSSSSESSPSWGGFRQLRVCAVQQECADVRSFTFESESRSALPTFVPGQFLVIKLKTEKANTPILRSYSISGPATSGTYRISVKRASGDGSRHVYDYVRPGDLLSVSAPRGSFSLRESDKPIVLLSAGIGATPVLSMLHKLAVSQSSQARQIWWCYGTRSGSDHPFANEVRSVLGRIPNSRSFVAYSRPNATDHVGFDCDSIGRLGLYDLIKLQVPKDADFYLCGPADFLAQLIAGLMEWGVPTTNIHSETFGGGPSLTPGIFSSSTSPHAPVGSHGAGPSVSFTRSGLSVSWDPKFGSLLELAEACNVPVRWSCRVGVCHTCETGIINGRIEYAPYPLDAPSGGRVLICCAKPLAETQLDL